MNIDREVTTISETHLAVDTTLYDVDRNAGWTESTSLWHFDILESSDEGKVMLNHAKGGGGGRWQRFV